MKKVTKEQIIKKLKELEEMWPDDLWLFSASGTLHLMKKTEGGDHAIVGHGGVDPNFSIETFDIENDGGDW